jgi:hypothetical protein
MHGAPPSLQHLPGTCCLQLLLASGSAHTAALLVLQAMQPSLLACCPPAAACYHIQEENFDEAIKAAFYAWTPYSIRTCPQLCVLMYSLVPCCWATSL